MSDEVCDARAARCRCHKTRGHVEAGDDVHGCDPTRCTGEWTGNYSDEPGVDDTFRVISLPFSISEPMPWGTNCER